MLCFQLLEEVEKLKDQCKDYEVKNKTLKSKWDTLHQWFKVSVLLAIMRLIIIKVCNTPLRSVGGVLISLPWAMTL